MKALEDKNERVRFYAVEGLLKFPDKAAFKPLQKFVYDKDEQVAENALECRYKIDKNALSNDLIRIVKDRRNMTIRIRIQALIYLREMKEQKAVDAIIEVLDEPDKNFLAFAFDALGRIGGDKSTNVLISYLSNKDEFYRAEAAEALGESRDKRAVSPLILLLKDDNESVREESVEALGKIRDKRAVTPLINLLTDNNKNVRIKSAEALGKIGDKRAVNSLVKLLSDTDTLVRMKSVTALGEIGDRRAVTPIIKAFNKEIMKDQNSEYVESCIQEMLIVFYRMKDKKAVIPIANALGKVKSYSSQELMLKILVETGDKRAIGPLKNFPSILEKEIKETVIEIRKKEWNPWKVAEFEKELRECYQSLIDKSKIAATRLQTQTADRR